MRHLAFIAELAGDPDESLGIARSRMGNQNRRIAAGGRE
jgi:hypothetical protein